MVIQEMTRQKTAIAKMMASGRIFRRFSKQFLLIGALAISAVMVATVKTNAGFEENYVFSAVSILPGGLDPDGPVDEAPHIEVSYSTAWSGTVFPGWHECQLELVVDGNEVVGHKTFRMVDLSRGWSEKQTDISVATMDEVGLPVAVRASCDAERLDDPAGIYEITDTRVARQPLVHGSPESTVLIFDDRWTGFGPPGVNRCVARFIDGNGGVLLSHEFNFSDAGSETNDFSMPLLSDYQPPNETVDVDVTCSPFGS